MKSDVSRSRIKALSPIRVILAGVLATGILAARQDPQPSGPIESWVEAAVESAKGSDPYATEHRASRRTYFFDVDADGDDDAVSLFLLEGFDQGNNHAVFMAVHRNEAAGWSSLDVVRVGESVGRHVDVERVDRMDGILRIGVREFARADPNCCPSLEGEAYYEVREGGLVEVTPRHPCLDARRCWSP